MGELRAYAVAAADLLAAVGSSGPERERFEALVRRQLAPPPPTPLDRLGPIHRRVPGAPVLSDDDPTQDDLDTLLDGSLVRRVRAAATWRLVEGLAAGLAVSSVTARDERVPDGLLTPLALPVPAVDGVVVGSCSTEAARVLPGLRTWATALSEVEPSALGVVVFATP